jgi:hypothetical protein
MSDVNEEIILPVYAVKRDDGEWELEVFAAPYGSPEDRDSQGEYFSHRTKFHLDKFKPAAVSYHGYGEDRRPSPRPEYIGRTVKAEERNDGVWLRVMLDKASKTAAQLWTSAKTGAAKLVASSGSVAHLVRTAKSGEILEWPMAEISIWEWKPGLNQSNKRAVAFAAMKAVYDEAGLTLPLDIEPTPEAAADSADGSSAESGAAAKGESIDKHLESTEMGKETTGIDIDAIVQGAVAANIDERVQASVTAALKADADARQAEQEREAAVKAQIEEAVTKTAEQLATKHAEELEAAKKEAAEGRRLPSGTDAPYQAKFGNVWKYDDLSEEDLSFGIGILQAAKSANRGRGVTEDMRKALAVRLVDSTDADHRAAQTSMKMAGMPMKANELNQSTLATFGDEWVSVTYSSQLWDKIRLATPVVAKLPTVTIPQGSESIIIPIQSTSPTFYKVAQASAQGSNPGRVTPTITTDKLSTGNRTLTAQKLGAAVNYTGELEEDSIIPWLSELRRDMVRESAEVLEHIVIDGDTDLSATTNINDIGGTPAATDIFTLFDGFRKLPLITNTPNSRSGTTLSVTDYLETSKLLGPAGTHAMDKRAFSYIVDPNTHWKTLEQTQVLTQDLFSQPTIENGMLTSLWGSEVINSANMHRASKNLTQAYLANSSGLIDLDTPANNTTGSILAVRWDQWRFGMKRMMKIEVERDAISDSNLIVVTMRVGLINRDNEASAISYNITV